MGPALREIQHHVLEAGLAGFDIFGVRYYYQQSIR
jgi:hypothetical protein